MIDDDVVQQSTETHVFSNFAKPSKEEPTEEFKRGNDVSTGPREKKTGRKSETATVEY